MTATTLAPQASGWTPADHRMTTGTLLSRTRAQLNRIADTAIDTLQNPHALYTGLTRAQTVTAAQHRLDDALFVLALKPSAARA